MILKIQTYPDGTRENFILGDILGVTYNSHYINAEHNGQNPTPENVSLIEPLYDFDLREKRDGTPYKQVWMIMKDSRELSLAFDTQGWLMNDNGKTIEKIN